jgi:hypothetical protein
MGIQSLDAGCGNAGGGLGRPSIELAWSPRWTLHTRLQLSGWGLDDFVAGLYLKLEEKAHGFWHLRGEHSSDAVGCPFTVEFSLGLRA